MLVRNLGRFNGTIKPLIFGYRYVLQKGLSQQCEFSYKNYIADVAKIEPPKELGALIGLLTESQVEFVDPRKKNNLNPFLIPVAKDNQSNSLLCYLRWPTQRDTMELQLVRTTPIGVELVGLNTLQYCQRLATEMEFYSHPNFVNVSKILSDSNISYTTNGFQSLQQSGRFPVSTSNDKRLLLDRYLLTKVAPFPDCYERIALNFFESGNTISALVTCERMMSLFSNWARPVHFHTKLLHRLGDRHLEVKESALSSLALPLWTLATDREDLEKAVELAGYSSVSVVGNMHAFRASDPRTKDIEEGIDPMQIPLDQAAHLMDAVTLGAVEGGWDAARAQLADKYRLGGYPDMADFVLDCDGDDSSSCSNGIIV